MNDSFVLIKCEEEVAERRPNAGVRLHDRHWSCKTTIHGFHLLLKANIIGMDYTLEYLTLISRR